LKKLFKGFGILCVLLCLILALGPRPDYKELSAAPYQGKFELTKLESTIQEREENTINLKSDNEARIIWYDQPAQQTEYAIVYLPGFTATYFEACPIPENLALKYGMNLYYARIHGHGIDDVDALKDVDPTQFLNSAKEAIAIAKTIGKKVVVMACSTGATYATYLASQDPEIESLIFLSPNFSIYDPRSALIDGPWGKQLMQYLVGGEYREIDYTEQLAQYWSKKYHIDALIALQYLIENTMEEQVYSKVNQSLFVGCYYASEEEQDRIVSVKEMRNMFNSVSTPNVKKQFTEFSNVDNHIIACSAVSNDVEAVESSIDRFLEKVLELKPIH